MIGRGFSDKRPAKTGSSRGRTGFGLASNFSFSKRGQREDWAGGAMGTMTVALGTLGFIVTKGATQGGGSSTRLSQVIT